MNGIQKIIIVIICFIMIGTCLYVPWKYSFEIEPIKISVYQYDYVWAPPLSSEVSKEKLSEYQTAYSIIQNVFDDNRIFPEIYIEKLLLEWVVILSFGIICIVSFSWKFKKKESENK